MAGQYEEVMQRAEWEGWSHRQENAIGQTSQHEARLRRSEPARPKGRRGLPQLPRPLHSLKDRGIGIPELVTSDAHEGLKAALRATLTATPWQRCQFHLQQNAQAYVPQVSMRRQVAADIRSVFDSPDRTRAEARLAEIVGKYRTTASRLAAWMESSLPEGLTIFQLPEHYRRPLRTSHGAESLNLRIKRRTRVAGLFPNEASVPRLVTAILMESSEEWETGRAYLTLQPQP